MPTRKPFRPIKPFVPGEKLSEVLKKIDYETLKNNKSWYASCERARQHWDGTGAGSQNAMRFYTGGHFGADAYEKAQKLYEIITTDLDVSKGFKESQEDEFNIFITKFLGLNTLVKYHVIAQFNSWNRKPKTFDVGEFCGELTAMLRADSSEQGFVTRVTNSVRANRGNVSRILSELENAIDVLARSIQAYLDRVYHNGASVVFNDYSPAYRALAATPENKGEMRSSMKATAGTRRATSRLARRKDQYEWGRFNNAMLILGALSGIALENNRADEVSMCQKLLTEIPD